RTFPRRYLIAILITRYATWISDSMPPAGAVRRRGSMGGGGGLRCHRAGGVATEDAAEARCRSARCGEPHGRRCGTRPRGAGGEWHPDLRDGLLREQSASRREAAGRLPRTPSQGDRRGGPAGGAAGGYVRGRAAREAGAGHEGGRAAVP